MKRTLAKFSVILLFFVAVTSCVRNDMALPDASINDVQIPDGFNWSSLKTSQLTVIPADTFDGKYYYVFEVFEENPILNESAKLLAKGVANVNGNYITDLVLPSSTNTVFVRQTSPVKGQTVQSVAVSGSSLFCNFRILASSAAKAMPKIPTIRSAKIVADEDPTPVGAIELTSKSSDVSWTNSSNYVIKAGETFSGSVVLGNNSALYVEGSYKLTGNKTFTMGAGSKLVIQNGGYVQFSAKKDFQFDAKTQIKNFGNLTSTNTLSFTNDALFYNYDTCDVVKFTATNTAEIHNVGYFYSNNSVELTTAAKLFNDGKTDFATFSTTNTSCTVTNKGEFNAKDINIASAPFSNEGTLTVAKTMQLASSCSVYNTGAVVTKDLITSSGAKIYNNCHWLVTNEFDAVGVTVYLYGQSLLKTSSLLCNGANIQMDGKAILEAEDAKFTTWRSTINGGTSDYALARMINIQPQKSNEISSNVTFEGKVEIEFTNCRENEQYNAFYQVRGSDVRWAQTGKSTTRIDKSDCNGNGNLADIETDPQTPTDPTFPILVNLTTDYSFIMEDNWPKLGDYDLNDLVVDLNISYLQNQENKATQMIVTYKLRAVGALKRIGAAFQLDKILPEQVSSVSYGADILTGEVFTTEKGVETGQTKAVIPMFDEAHAFLSNNKASGMLNTIIDETYYTPQSNTVTITFAQPIDPSDISIANLNFFIVTDGFATLPKRTEIHLSGFEPTDKMDTNLFATADDASSVSGKYRTANNLVWGLLIPTSFQYASEWRDITSVYPQFGGWCTSSGVENVFWYQNPTDKSRYVFKKE